MPSSRQLLGSRKSIRASYPGCGQMQYFTSRSCSSRSFVSRVISFGNSAFFLLYSFVTLYSRQIMTLSLYLLACLVIAVPICLHLITLHRSCRSTIFPIIVLGRSSTSPFGSRATLFELLNHLQRFQKAIKKVRAVQRMRRNRGFAFSQTEDPSRPQDQARLIRAYDTSKSNARPSGY